MYVPKNAYHWVIFLHERFKTLAFIELCKLFTSAAFLFNKGVRCGMEFCKVPEHQSGVNEILNYVIGN